MKSAAVDTTFDVVYWLIDQAINDDEYLQPQKLHRLMFLAQAFYAVTEKGRRLMPCLFIAHELGPLEPNIYRLYEGEQRPYIDARLLPEEIEDFMKNIWRRFGAHSAEHLTRVVKNHAPYAEAYAEEPRSEITIEAMVKFYGAVRTPSQSRAMGVPNADQVIKPKILRTQTGKAVTVKQWLPKGASPPGK